VRQRPPTFSFAIAAALFAAVGVLGLGPTSVSATPTVAIAADISSGSASPHFSREILPVLSNNCFSCHGPDASHRKGKLRLDDENDAKRPREHGAAIVPGKSAESEMVLRLLSTEEDEVMPPLDSHKKLTSHQIDAIKRWIDGGAPWGTHWAFSELTPPSIPPSPNPATTARTPLDAFVVARLAEEKLSLAPSAEKSALLRRVTLDLTGLPPTPAELSAYLADPDPSAYERRVDRLLASPAYGERMAWDWMEIARYADTNGYQGDRERTMWPWRDWVVKAFNENLPYDRFTIWQLAGDLLPDATVEQKMATAFLRNHPINGEGGRIAEENRVDYVMDMAETTGTAWMALTMNCCRCHDHKFDPLSQRDYYALNAFFNQTSVTGEGGNPQTKPVVDLTTKDERDRLAALEAGLEPLQEKLEALEQTLFVRPAGETASKAPLAEGLSAEVRQALINVVKKRNADQLGAIAAALAPTQPEYVRQTAALRTAVAERERYARALVRVMVMEDQPTLRKTFVLDRGLYNKPLSEVTASTPAKLPPLPKGVAHDRLALARWLVSKENPLTARVTANRLWQMFFGIGLVKTAEDFGVQSEFPKHADLLDWLAADFRDSGWDVKRFVRQIVTSDTYRQSSRVTSEQLERDPENRLLARGPRYRLPSWMLRDQALAASGLLVARLGGPAVKPYQPPGVWEEATFGKTLYTPDSGDALYRRSLYTFWRRIVGPTMFFDAAPRSVCTVMPTRTNTPLHALSTLNDVTYVEAARVLAEKVLAEETNPAARLAAIFSRLLARSPSAEEAAILLSAAERHRAEFAASPEEAQQLLAVGESPSQGTLPADEHAAWTAVCLAVLNFDETLSKE